jgi:hypothetical protein
MCTCRLAKIPRLRSITRHSINCGFASPHSWQFPCRRGAHRCLILSCCGGFTTHDVSFAPPIAQKQSRFSDMACQYSRATWKQDEAFSKLVDYWAGPREVFFSLPTQTTPLFHLRSTCKRSATLRSDCVQRRTWSESVTQCSTGQGARIEQGWGRLIRKVGTMFATVPRLCDPKFRCPKEQRIDKGPSRPFDLKIVRTSSRLQV